MEDTPDEAITATVNELTTWLNERAEVLGVRPNSLTSEYVAVVNWQSLDDGTSFLTILTPAKQMSSHTTGLLYEALNWHLGDERERA